MKMIKNKSAAILLALVMILPVSSCELFDLDVNTDPNNPSEASVDLLLTNVQLDASSIFAGGLNDMASGFMVQSTSTDDFNMNNGTWNNTWNLLYQGPLNDLERVIVAAEEKGNIPATLGAAQVLKAYYFSLMVDLWNNVPYSQAFKGDQGIKAPAYDDAETIYNDLIALLDKAIVNFDAPSTAKLLGDVIYDNGLGDSRAAQVAKWKKAAKSLKLRLLLQLSEVRNVTAEIQALVDEGDLILTAANDFQFQFGKLQAPDDRHPWYQNGYAGGEAGANYFAHQFMFEMLRNEDPRTPFYFKRQTKTVLDPEDPTARQTIPCSQREDCFYGYFPLSPFVTNAIFGSDPGDLAPEEAQYLAGFFGRDRSDPSGVPNDNPIRTTIGAYPAAGLFDDVPEAGGGNKGSGAGIFPMITSWMVNFYILEAKLRLGVTSTTSDAQLLKNAVSQQIVKVFSVGIAADAAADSVTANWEYPIDFLSKKAFVDQVVAGYPIAGTTNDKLQYVLKQAWFANYGNGYETYNAFRRTGYPNDLQTPLQRPRQFALRLPYAQDELNLNATNTPNVVYDDPDDAVFWDLNPFQF